MTSPNRDKQNKPSKRAVGVNGSPKAERLAESTAVINSSAPKPSKKTEWEKEFDEKVDSMYGDWWIQNLDGECWFDTKTLKEFVKDLLHQRDNEIREKIQGMRKRPYKTRGVAKIGADFSKFGGKRFDAGDINEFEIFPSDLELSYNQALDDLLTYLDSTKP